MKVQSEHDAFLPRWAPLEQSANPTLRQAERQFPFPHGTSADGRHQLESEAKL